MTTSPIPTWRSILACILHSARPNTGTPSIANAGPASTTVSMRSTFQQPTLQLLRVEDDKRLVSHLVFNTGQDWSQSNGRQGQITFTIKTEPITSEVLEQVPESMSAEVLVHHPANCPLDLMMENVTLGDLLRSEIPDTQLINFGAPMRYVKCNLPSENAGVLGFAFVDGSGREHRVNARPIEMEFVTPGPVWADTQSILAAIEERRLPESVARGLQQLTPASTDDGEEDSDDDEDGL